MVQCVFCGTENPLPPQLTIDRMIVIDCRNCHRKTPTGKEEEVRKTWEQCVSRSYPKVTAARAIGLANAIYKTAEADVNTISIGKTREALKEAYGKGFDAKGIIGGYLIKGRVHGGFTDPTAVAAILIIDNGQQTPRYSIYVVFRGSSGAMRAHEDQSVNVDWRANFDNGFDTTGYTPDSIKVHRGFKASLSSYRDRVLRGMNMAIQDHPDSHVVITGHSQGAGHAILFAHWLSYIQPTPRPFVIPYSPPRTGNFAFAHDFSIRLSMKPMALPYDGMPAHGAYLMVKGEDPVVWGMKHSFSGRTIQETWSAADAQLKDRWVAGYRGLLDQAAYAESAEKYRYNPSEVYFHPLYLTQISSWTPKIGKLKALDHDPGSFRDKILSNL